jgi:hypothetical protein
MMAYRDVRQKLDRQALAEKVDHVRAAANLEPLHTCHWPGCDRRVKPAIFMCRGHWYSLPIDLRGRIWRTYVPGQENTKTPSEQYLAVVRDVMDWIKRNHRT